MNDLQILYAILGVLGVALVTLGFILFARTRDVSEVRAHLARTAAELESANLQVQNLSSQNENLEHELGLQTQEFIRVQTTLLSREERLKEREERIANLQDELKNQAQNEDELERELANLRQNLGTASEINRTNETQIAYLKESLALLSAQNQAANAQNSTLIEQLAKLKTSLEEKERSFKAQQENFIEVKERLNVEFQSLASKILEEKSLNFTKTNQASIELVLKPLRERIEGFEKRVNEVHTEAVKGNASLEAEIKKVLEIGLAMSKDAKNLTTALKGSNKLAGGWGEAQLEASLQAAGLVRGEHYEAQSSYRGEEGERLVPDFVVKMPDGKHLVIDSKVSLLAYERAVNATDEASTAQAMSEHVSSLKSHINSLAKKDYSAIGELKSPDFVLMFVPIEPAYIEAMRYDTQLFGYGYERRVVLVSHTTLMPILRTVANLWRIEQGNKEAREIARSAGEIYNNVCAVAEVLKRLGNTLNAASTHYNDAVTKLAGRQGLYGKVEKFGRLSHKAAAQMPAVGELSAEFSTKNLQNLTGENLESSEINLASENLEQDGKQEK